ncbi:MAG: hypothetical protein IKN94_07565 [Salinivirgaceae bacterium]|nr:hypothetical protein [Salinivirgaceae bacterium]
MKKYALFIFAALLSFLACKKDNNSNDPQPFPPIVVDDSTAEFNVLFYGNFCADCPYAHYNLYVDSVYMGKLYGCYTEGDCKCDSNPDGLRALIATGMHTYKAIPYCGWIDDEDKYKADWYLEEKFEVPADNCISVYVSNF